MHFRILILFVVFCTLYSCNRISRRIDQRFEEVDKLNRESVISYDFKEENFFIMSIQEQLLSKVETDDGQIVLNETPFRSFSVLYTQDFTLKNIVDEVYLYLNGFGESNEGDLLYFINTPLIHENTKSIFNNPYFLSIMAVRDVRLGRWKKTPTDAGATLELSFKYEGRDVTLTGISIANKLNLMSVSHPKPNKHADVTEEYIPMVEISDVLGVSSSEGLCFHQNSARRRVVYPDRSKLGRYFEGTKEQHLEVNSYRYLDSLFIDKNNKDVYLKYYLDRSKTKPGFLKTFTN